MSLRRKKPGDSLDLLLDTMCNTFGGIIMIAVLITLLTRQEQHTKLRVDSDEMLRRRIAEAELTIAESHAAHSNLIVSAKDGNLKQRMELMQQARALKREIDLLTQERESIGTEMSASMNSAARAEQLRREMVQVTTMRADLTNQLGTAELNANRMSERIENLKRQAETLQASAIQNVRLPKERLTGKSVFNVLVKYGRIYPLLTSDLDPNTAHLSITRVGEGIIARPLPDAGLNPRGSEWQAVLRSLAGSRFYLAFYVHEGSFGTFNAAKQAAVSAGIEYGWEPSPGFETMSFGPRGSRPNAQ